MEYDQTSIPEGYNRAREHGPAFLEMWMDVVLAHRPPKTTTILDLGCGTGRFTAALATRLQTCTLGLDPSRKMLSQARERQNGPQTHYAIAQAEALPLRENSLSLIFISMAYHHFTNKPLAARECWRTLAVNGRVCLRTGTRDRVGDYPYVPYFPSSRRLIEERIPALDDQCRTFEEAGFQTVARTSVVQEVAASPQAYAEKLAAGGDSILASIDPTEFRTGLETIRSISAAQAIVEPIDFIVFEKTSRSR